MKRWAPLAGLILALVIAFGFDYWLFGVRRQAAESLNPYPVTVVMVLAQTVVGAVVLALAWRMLLNPPRDKLLGVIFLILGLPLLISPMLYFTPIGQAVVFVSPNGLLWQAGGYAALIGLAALVLPIANRA